MELSATSSDAAFLKSPIGDRQSALREPGQVMSSNALHYCRQPLRVRRVCFGTRSPDGLGPRYRAIDMNSLPGCVALLGCASAAQQQTTKMETALTPWVGRSIGDYVAERGPPTTTIDLGDNKRAFQWQMTRQTPGAVVPLAGSLIVVPSHHRRFARVSRCCRYFLPWSPSPSTNYR